MSDEQQVLVFDSTITRVRADNPGPMTLTGTNTWILAAPGQSAAVVIDPGPMLQGHLDAVSAHLRERELAVEVVLLTHGHLDHSEGAEVFAASHDAPVRAADARWSTAAPLQPDELITAAGVDLAVLATPGHTSDSVTFVGEDAMFTGDTVLGYGTTVVAHPDGLLADYLDSLRLLYDIAIEGGHRLLPGHGPAHGSGAPLLTQYIAHRRQRLDQVRTVLTSRHGHLLMGSEDLMTGVEGEAWLAHVVEDIVAEVYRDVPDDVKVAAAHSVRAQVRYLIEHSEEAEA